MECPEEVWAEVRMQDCENLFRAFLEALFDICGEPDRYKRTRTEGTLSGLGNVNLMYGSNTPLCVNLQPARRGESLPRHSGPDGLVVGIARGADGTGGNSERSLEQVFELSPRVLNLDKFPLVGTEQRNDPSRNIWEYRLLESEDAIRRFFEQIQLKRAA